MTTQDVFSLVKGCERFIFRYTPGSENELLATWVEMANDPASSFDWFDAAVLSYQLGCRLDRSVQSVA